MMEDTANLVPLALLADAWGSTTDALAAELGDHVLTDQLGIKHTAVTDALALLAQRQAREEAHRQEELERCANMAAINAPVRARVAALQAQQRALRNSGQIDHDSSAFDVMLCGENERRLAPASRRMDGWLQGKSEGYMFNPQPAQEE
jgi:hypothetical protein